MHDSPCKQQSVLDHVCAKGKIFSACPRPRVRASSPPIRSHTLPLDVDKPRHEGEAFNLPNCFVTLKLPSFAHENNISCGGGVGALPSLYYAMIAQKNGSTSNTSSVSSIIQYGSNRLRSERCVTPAKRKQQSDMRLAASSRMLFRRMGPSLGVIRQITPARTCSQKSLAASNFHVDQDCMGHALTGPDTHLHGLRKVMHLRRLRFLDCTACLNSYAVPRNIAYSVTVIVQCDSSGCSRDPHFSDAWPSTRWEYLGFWALSLSLTQVFATPLKTRCPLVI